ncbi:Zn peptidase [Rhodococcus sp. 05-2255-3B1]|uniref:ImmA/IrrE family metallo-endopeptidase n=1 Tax=unclassified Rhodococcus (in: high G+C Gram-positive bacteria) TaxID=192944 RepID=UPI000B9A5EEF|nr:MULTISPECIES: ImmA/IrrE family metallo-endopeptidase [unclassified Rhodococcus (in: high G+C Gram-positive bacteria)]OZE13484.1 Zn peptidase [Rhodococcus sp. 05-2255-3C]OZE15900.1 Zn peptidase [Rhodococcus sp. 05-2255-3B1]OZE18939.1 Zn peptidase [Rhodococcus sp. 05-2255-2A2]
MTDRNQLQTHSVLAHLRSVIPRRSDVTHDEALRIAELQANKLLAAHGVINGATPTEIISELPKIEISYTGSLIAGASYWDTARGTWVILLNRADSLPRQRFTLAHEYKHIIDHGRSRDLYRGSKVVSASTQIERIADYFAGCLLIPRRALKGAWGSGMQRTDDLAAHFEVSALAIAVRLRQTGLVDVPQRFRNHTTIGSCDAGEKNTVSARAREFTS